MSDQGAHGSSSAPEGSSNAVPSAASPVSQGVDSVARELGLEPPGELLSAAELADLGALETAEIRTRRQRCEQAEEGISYARRMLQGRLDLLRAELARRDDPAAGQVLSDLGRVLGGNERSGGDPARARSTRVRLPDDDGRIAALLDRVVSESTLLSAQEVPLTHLESAVEGYAALEGQLSSVRRALFDRIDALRDELAARYKDGRADVSELLR